ncbi:MAG TPA: hypothetical protein VJ599_04365, partial [Nitrososphaeraceae archaeon]|nr:hypothetical protein [Nitrososphaeraceae archaeon]
IGMGRSIPFTQLADGITRGWILGDDGTRKATEVIVAIQDPPTYGTPGIKVSEIYTWKRYPAGRAPPPPDGPPVGSIVSELDVTITAVPNSPPATFYFVFETLNP